MPSRSPAKGTFLSAGFSSCAVSGTRMKNASAAAASRKDAQSTTSTAPMPKNDIRNAAKMGVNMPTSDPEMDCSPAMRVSLSLGTSMPLTTADAGCWNAFIKPTMVLTVRMCPTVSRPISSAAAMDTVHRNATPSHTSMMRFLRCASTNPPANTLTSM